MALSLDLVLEMSAIPFKEKEQNEKPFSCSVCQRCFSGVGFLKAHFQRAHHKSPFPLLPLNGNKSGSIKTHKSHSIIASKEKSLYSCDLCSKTFPRKLDLIKHEFMHRSKHGFPHIHIHHQSANSLNCSACNSHFIYKKDFKNHVSTKCEMCFKVICRNWFSTKSVCKSEKECGICKRDLCEDCHKLHQASTILKGEYECIVCKTNFTEKRCLKDHYARTHSIVKLTY